MKNLGILLSLFILSLSTTSNAAEVVYPKSQNVVINSPVTFFIGNEEPNTDLRINDEKVKIHPSGGFYHAVDLNFGDNVFIIYSDKNSKTYTITRNKESITDKTSVKKYYNEAKIFVTDGKNIPLRATPVDGGDNRLQHFNDKIALSVIGEVGDFYIIQLARDDYAYIKKQHVKPCDCADISPAKILNYTYQEDENSRIYTIKLDKKVPYVLSETRIYHLSEKGYEPDNGGLDLVIYNVSGFDENKYNLHINSQERSFGYNSFYNSSNELTIQVKKYPQINKFKPLKGIKITIDPGHGGSEYGAIGCLADKEKDINLSIALKLRPLLQKAGAEVFMTRDDDNEVSLNNRVEFSQNNNSDIFISIHNNALPDSLAKTYRSGTSTYYFYPQSAELARVLQDTLTEELSTNDDKIRQESFAVIRNTQSLAILLEVAYMINPDDNAKLHDEQFRQKAAEAILHGLEKYFNVQQ